MQRTTQQSIIELLAAYQRKGHAIRRASLVVGSQIDPATIANSHVRAHLLEGQLFRLALEQILSTHDIHTVILLERDAYAKAASRRKQTTVDVRRTIKKFGQSTDGPWRAEQKLAALAAWFALCED